ncbi:UDP-N-acetylmuramate dehydrogenase [Butyrivibrio sp.]|uniref:UDP-N-acetylmuramate dehydrogenase n=1 Tax=Butyrivibrio sp. TaxID=28121 RepID=UPI0025BB6C5A|nr:UDP-N-acetylmuramate dehydrogenase [Butyrivibrio sp.]MBE5838196.1 UDP-N-acetylmuramate dehydrogenase [Butyrivibrio sp.]
MNEGIINAIEQIVSASNVLENEPMSRHTTFRTGGPASLFIRPENKGQLVEVMALIKKLGTEFFVLGNGSNLLVSDKGFDGVVISLSKMNDIHLEGDNDIYAEAGAMNSQIAAFARDNGLKNFEFAAGIPGTIGGAMIMNAGAYGGEMKLVTRSVTVLSPEGEIMVLDNASMEFGYRSSAIKGRGYIVISVLLSLEKGDKETITKNMQELAAKRREKQPLEFPSAGSTFKRPEGYFAGKLIEDAGLRGFSVGDAAVSEKHCGFVINKGNATSAEVYELICEVKKRVYENSGVTLEPEVIMLGKF